MMYDHQFIGLKRNRERSMTVSGIFLIAFLYFIAPYAIASEQQMDGPDQALSSEKTPPPAPAFEALSRAEQQKKNMRWQCSIHSLSCLQTNCVAFDKLSKRSKICRSTKGDFMGSVASLQKTSSPSAGRYSQPF